MTILSLDIGGTQVRAALVRGSQIISSRSFRWPPPRDPFAEVDDVIDLIQKLMGDLEAGQVTAIGIALAALTGPDGVVVQWPNRPHWSNLPFRTLLEAHLGLPLALEDDANAAALAEWRFGAGKGYQHVLVIMAGTGIGAGFILDGRLFHGQHGWAGEFGHQVMLPDGPLCGCGLRGCLQALASGRALERAAAEHGLPDAPALTDAAAQGEGWACEVLATCGRWLGLAAANVVNLLDIQAVIIGGTLSTLPGPLWPSIEQTLHANVLNQRYRPVLLHRALLPDTAGLIGAAELAAQLVST